MNEKCTWELKFVEMKTSGIREYSLTCGQNAWAFTKQLKKYNYCPFCGNQIEVKAVK